MAGTATVCAMPLTGAVLTTIVWAAYASRAICWLAVTLTVAPVELLEPS